MADKIPENPFVLSAYYSKEYFCDRELETKKLMEHMINNRHVTIFAKRRIGKTGLILHTLESLEVKKKYGTIYLDILPTNNFQDFVNVLANHVYQKFPEKKSIGKKFIETIQMLRPVLSFDDFSGLPEVSIVVDEPKLVEKSINQIFKFLDNIGQKVIIAIDEFQQIAEYPEKNVESILRTQIQHLTNVVFIFSGSHLTMMQDIFSNVKKPFYASTQNLFLDHIPKHIYKKFIAYHFSKEKKKITEESIDYILDFSDAYTFYTQTLCNRVFSGTGKVININKTKEIAYSMLRDQEHIYYQYRNLLTSIQWQLLIAIGKEEVVHKPYSSKFIKKHDLDSASSVKRSLESLIKKEMVYYELREKDSIYKVYDQYLMKWLKYKY